VYVCVCRCVGVCVCVCACVIWLRHKFSYSERPCRGNRDRRGGRDHIWLMAADEGACWMPTAIYNTSIVLTHWGRMEPNHTSGTAYLQVSEPGRHLSPRIRPATHVPSFCSHVTVFAPYVMAAHHALADQTAHAPPPGPAPTRLRTYTTDRSWASSTGRASTTRRPSGATPASTPRRFALSCPPLQCTHECCEPLPAGRRGWTYNSLMHASTRPAQDLVIPATTPHPAATTQTLTPHLCTPYLPSSRPHPRPRPIPGPCDSSLQAPLPLRPVTAARRAATAARHPAVLQVGHGRWAVGAERRQGSVASRFAP
jgi:hypothetical protein